MIKMQNLKIKSLTLNLQFFTLNLATFGFLLLALPLAALGQSKIENLSADETTKEYERKAILATQDLGLGSKTVVTRVRFCPYNNPRFRFPLPCIPIGTKTLEINSSLEKKLNNIYLEKLVSSRFDKVVLAKDQVVITTAQGGTISKSAGGLPNFSFETGSYKQFKGKVEDFLGGLNSPMQELLAAAKDARYAEMSDREKESFAVQKAKTLDMPVEFIEKLMNSSYVFALYLPKVRSSATITQVGRTMNGYVVGYSYVTRVNSPTRPKLLIYNYKAPEGDGKGKFVYYDTVDGDSGHYSESVSRPFRPSLRDIDFIFPRALLGSVNSSAKNLKQNLIKDDLFAIVTPVTQASLFSLSANIGTLEDLRIDAPYRIKQTNAEEGVIGTGFAKARRVFKNKYKGNGKGEKTQPVGDSQFDIVQGYGSMISSLQEHPWSGTFLYLGLDSVDYGLTEINGLEVTGGNELSAVRFGMNVDLGYTFNDAKLSETWFDASLFFGGGSDYAMVGDTQASTTPSFGGLAFDMYKRFYIGPTGVYVSPFAGLAYYSSSYDVESIYGYDNALDITSLILDVGVKTGLNLGPDWEIYFTVNLPQILSSTVKYGDTDYTVDSIVEAGPTLSIGLSWQIETLGNLSKFGD
ncbi:MAG: hypothetical protein QNL04_14590 [SAR324 cluster bacterium]|nr:hypothetical protein [SAR324 cluster bacterium]